MIENPTKTNKLSKIFTFLIIIMPIINNYSSPVSSIGIGELFLLILLPIMIIYIVWEKINFDEYLIFFSYGILISLLIILFYSRISSNDVIIRLARDAFYVILVFICAQKFIDISFAIKLYKMMVVIVCSYIILETISFYIFGYIMPWIITRATLNYATTNTATYMQFYYRLYSSFFRPTSVFLEPSQFAQYVAPCLVLILFPFSKETKINYYFAVYVTVSLLFSTSANAYVFIALIWSIWLYKYTHKVKFIKKAIIMLSSLLIILIAYYNLFNYNNSFNRVINRLFFSSNIDLSSSIRLFSGISFYNALDPIYKIFGIGFGSFNSMKETLSITTIYETKSEYMSTLSYILVSTGIIGLILFIYAMRKIYIRGPECSKVLIILLLVICLSSSIYSQPIYIVILSFALYSPKEITQTKVITN